MPLKEVKGVRGHYAIEGPLKLRVLRGCVELTGKELGGGDEAVVPAAKATLLEAVDEAEVELLGGGSIIELEASTIPREWVEFVESVSGHCTISTIGPMDSGKTFFVTYAANKLIAKGSSVAVVDCDVGQSNIGPPTSIGLGFLDGQVVFLDEVQPSEAYFVGSTSPAGHLLPMVVGTLKLVSSAKARCGVLLVDTPGMIYGGPARAYQLHVAEAVNPDVVVALQREGEGAHLARHLKSLGYEVVELPASPWVRRRSQDERRRLRERAFHNYFTKKGVAQHAVDLRGVAILGSFMGSGCPLQGDAVKLLESMAGCGILYGELSADSLILVLDGRPKDRDFYAKLRGLFPDRAVKVLLKGFERGLVVGLIGSGGRLLDIGIMIGLDFKEHRATVATPLKGVDEVKAVKLGCVRLDEEYGEVERLEPGYA
ncbi:MAG: Clp1/GlmU family protein [Candidatus Nezhaarchaeota archaeon]|nr:Clp1/GlmU family protein [Candidatus Nezhaarchaeota archaeon]